ncbi:MAG: hypothetical protein AAFW74_01580 [Pseudomonadota bacterium]
MTYKLFRTVALTIMVLTPLSSYVQAADYDPVPQYGDWAFRIEGGAGYTGITFRPEGGPGETFDGGIANTTMSAAFRMGRFFTQLDGTFGFSKEEEFVKQGVFGILLGWRDPEQGMLAVHVSATGDSGAGTIFQIEDFWRIGGVGELFLGRFSIGAAGGIVEAVDTPGFDTDIHYAKGVARYYINDNLKLEGHGGIVHASLREPFFSDSVDTFYGRFLAEYKPDASNIGYFVRWDGVIDLGDIDGETIESHTVMAGVRLYFGEPAGTSIKTYDRAHFADSCTQGAAGAFLSFC